MEKNIPGPPYRKVINPALCATSVSGSAGQFVHLYTGGWLNSKSTILGK